MKVKYTLELYKQGKITLMKAAEIAGIPLWDILDIVRTKRITMYYTLEDVEKDMKFTVK